MPDPDANFRAEVEAYAQLDPMTTIERVAASTGIPADAIVNYILAKWAAEGSETLLAVGPRTVERMWSVVEQAEEDHTDAARLEAYDVLRQMLAWLRAG